MGTKFNIVKERGWQIYTTGGNCLGGFKDFKLLDGTIRAVAIGINEGCIVIHSKTCQDMPDCTGESEIVGIYPDDEGYIIFEKFLRKEDISEISYIYSLLRD